jgi:hypothetical protein
MNSGMGFPYQIINLGFVLLCTTSDNEMTKKTKGLHLKFLIFSNVQKITQLSYKGRFN